MSGLVVRQGKVSENNNEQGISYDLMGNLTGLNRTGVFTHSLAYAYTGNQLTTITNSGAAFRSYGYDANGNATSDGQGNAISYNMLNPPQSIPGKGLTYTYDAAGTKLRKVSGTTTTEYISGIQYTGTAIDFVQTEEGRAINSGGSYTYEYNLADHLGNTRLSLNQNGVTKQQDDYYPFGLEINRSTTSPKNEYLYNKKELQEETGLYDYGARFYDPIIARWTAVDPMAEMGRRWSPYIYGFNNPMRFTDPDGMWPDGPGDDEHGTGNDMSLVENVIYSTRDMVTSGVATLVSGIKSLFGGEPMKEASFTYSGGQRTLSYSPLTSTTDKLAATGNAFLGIASIVPVDGPAAGIFAKASGVKSSVATIVKEAIHANSKASTLENTLYHLETTEGRYLKTGVTSKAIPEKRYTNGFMKDKRMIPLDKGSRAEMLNKERGIIEKKPGPLNKEPWAGKQAN